MCVLNSLTNVRLLSPCPRYLNSNCDICKPTTQVALLDIIEHTANE